jgi:hypothetical protein
MNLTAKLVIPVNFADDTDAADFLVTAIIVIFNNC